MDDSDGDDVYTVTVDIAADTIEYKFTLDGWTAQEEFAGGESCTSTIDGFTNRSYIVAAEATLPVVCYNSCDACDGAGGGEMTRLRVVLLTMLPIPLWMQVMSCPYTEVHTTTLPRITIPSGVSLAL